MMSKQARGAHPLCHLPPKEIEGFDPLAQLRMDNTGMLATMELA
jgi:hypothetical protein